MRTFLYHHVLLKNRAYFSRFIRLNFLIPFILFLPLKKTYTFSLFSVNTPDKLEYQFFPASNGVFTFKIRAPNDAHLALTTQPSESFPMYEVFIGGWGNTKSVIRQNGQKPDVVEVPTPQILNANEYRGFWIRWYDQTITVGREGEASAFMTRHDPHLFPIKYVGICTGWGASGTWTFDGMYK